MFVTDFTSWGNLIEKVRKMLMLQPTDYLDESTCQLLVLLAAKAAVDGRMYFPMTALSRFSRLPLLRP